MILLMMLAAIWPVPQLKAFAAGRAEAADGVIDLTQFRFDRDIAELNGEWRFYWEQLLEPQDFEGEHATARHAGQLVRVPDTWQSYTVDGRQLPGQGYATYRLVLRFSEAEIGNRFALRIGNAATAYRLWIGGRDYGGNGVVGTDRRSMAPANYSRSYSFVLESTETAITIQAANFVQRKSGLWDAVQLGHEDRVMRREMRELAAESAFAGIFVVIGFYHLLLFLLSRENREALYFGSLCALIGLRVSVTGQSMLYRLLPDMSWKLGVKIEYLGFIGATLFFLLYYGALFPREMNRRLTRAAAVVLALCALAVTALPAIEYTRWLLAFSALVLAVILYVGLTVVLALWRRRPDAWLHAAAWIFILLTAMNDILFYNLFIQTDDLLPYGILTALLIQVTVLSLRSVRAYRDIRRLSGELARFNDELEAKIRERTAELEQTNEELREAWYTIVEIEQSRRRLMSNVSHELGTPLSVIQGYVKGMLDGVIPAADPKVLHLIYDKMLTLDRIVGDLGELSKLEARMVTFDPEPLDVGRFVERTAESMRRIFQQADIRLVCISPREETDGLLVNADPVRLEQAVANLLLNARKHTPPGGTVRIGFGAAEEEGRKMAEIFVEDTGKGISPDVLPFVFDRHFQARSDAAGRNGMGLGLAICKEIVEMHGGTIGVESPGGDGSRFHIRLPLHSEATGEHGEADQRS